MEPTTLTPTEQRSLLAFRRSSHAPAIRAILAKYLKDARAEYVGKTADEAQRLRIADSKTAEYALFEMAV